MKSAIYSEVENRILITIKFGEFFQELLIIRDAVISKTRRVFILLPICCSYNSSFIVMIMTITKYIQF